MYLKVSYGSQHMAYNFKFKRVLVCFIPADSVSACERLSFWRLPATVMYLSVFLQIMHKAGSTGPEQAIGSPVLDLSFFVGQYVDEILFPDDTDWSVL